MKLFTEEERDFLINNWQVFSNKELAEIIGHGIKDSQVRSFLYHNGISRRGKKKNEPCTFTDKDVEFIKNNYLSMSYKEIGEILGFTERQIRGKVNNMGYRKTREINDSYFDVIDDPDKAYFLGYIYADGWIVYNEKHRNYEFGMQLQSQDKYILEILNEKLGGLNIISHSDGRGMVKIAGHYANSGPSDTLRVYSKKLVLGLMNNGIALNKSHKDIYPVVDKKYFPDFLRGYIDGDGWYSKSKSITYMGLTCCRETPLKYIQEELSTIGIKSSLYKEHETKYVLCCTSKKQMYKLINYLYYSNNILCLSRKYEKIKHYIGPLVQ